jgi:hypothetical protein
VSNAWPNKLEYLVPDMKQQQDGFLLQHQKDTSKASLAKEGKGVGETETKHKIAAAIS